MQLHELPKFKTKRSQRVGRGGKRGTYSGRGTKGQKSRSGRRLRPAERDLILRIPKRRGFKNKPKSEKVRVFNVGDLTKIMQLQYSASGKAAVVNRATFVVAGILPARYKGPIKILGTGEIKTAATFEGLRVSTSAKAKIEKAGGTIK